MLQSKNKWAAVSSVRPQNDQFSSKSEYLEKEELDFMKDFVMDLDIQTLLGKSQAFSRLYQL